MWTEFEEYSLVSFFSDVGGSMGLLMGLSIFSLVKLGHQFLSYFTATFLSKKT